MIESTGTAEAWQRALRNEILKYDGGKHGAQGPHSEEFIQCFKKCVEARWEEGKGEARAEVGGKDGVEVCRSKEWRKTFFKENKTPSSHIPLYIPLGNQ